VEPVVIAKQKILDSLQTVLDPELQVSILDLGLIYRVEVESGRIEIDYTLTNPGCPVGPMIEEQIREALREITDIDDIQITLVWEPPWKPKLMSEDLRLSLGYPI
jgi:metal-sulfur cluster biosynthetic enzyme